MNKKGAIEVLFRTEAGPQIGLGHLRRSTSLAAAFKQRGISSQFAIDDYGEGLAEWGDRDLEATVGIARSSKVPVVVVDSPRVTADYLIGLQKAGCFVVVRDDMARVFLPAQMVVNGNADAGERAYPALTRQTSFLLGPEYAVLPPKFWKPSARVVRDPVGRVLVTLGGADTGGLTGRLIRWLDQAAGDFSVTAVLGPFFNDPEEIQGLVRAAGKSMRCVRSPDSMFDLMCEADVAISGAGQTLYELACAGCPTVAVQMGDDQEGQLRALARTGVVLSAGRPDRPEFWAQLEECFLKLMRDASIRKQMAQAGQKLVDGRGALRVTEGLLGHPSFCVLPGQGTACGGVQG